MRIFAGIVGALFVLIGLAAGLASAIAIGVTDSDHSGDSWSCRNSPGGSSLECSYDFDSNPSDNATGNAVGITLAIGGGAFLVGGCALIGGAVAGSGRKQAATTTYPQQSATSAAPPSYGGGSGWQGGPGGDSPRS